MRAPKKRTAWIGVLVGVGAVLGGMGTSAEGQAVAAGKSTHSSNRCSDATLHGRYDFAAESTQVSGPAPNGPFAYAGFIYYDGRGRDRDVYTFSAGGTISHLVRETGRYHVDANCIETETDSAPGVGTQHYNQFVSPDGSQFAFIQSDKGIVSAGTAIRTKNS